MLPAEAPGGGAVRLPLPEPGAPGTLGLWLLCLVPASVLTWLPPSLGVLSVTYKDTVPGFRATLVQSQDS